METCFQIWEKVKQNTAMQEELFCLCLKELMRKKNFQKSCRMWAKDMLPGYDYLIAFHLKSNDKKTHQPHCHILLRTISKDGKRFHLDNQETAAFQSILLHAC